MEEPLRTTVLVCLGGALLALAAGSALGHWRAGLAVGLGLLAGSANGFLARRALRAGVGFGLTSLGRLTALSVVGLGLAALLGLQLAPLVLGGVAGAQVVLAVVSAVLAVRT
jgi:hypothetical protein